MSIDKLYPETGHNLPGKGVKEDPGAMADGYKENELTILFMNSVLEEFEKLGGKFERDDDHVSLAANIATIRKTITNSDIVYSVHFNAASPLASGTEVFVSNNAGDISIKMAGELVNTASMILDIPNRGVKREKDSPRKRLAVLNMKGAAVLHEVCFITNKKDMRKFFENYPGTLVPRYKVLAKEVAVILKKYDDLMK
jgi:N-acetylmuramoyl-L-alanine amidase